MRRVLLMMLAVLGMATSSYAGITFKAVGGSASNTDVSGEGWENVCDGDTATKWCQKAQSGCYAIIEASEPTYVIGYKMTTANDNEKFPGRTPKEFKIYGSTSKDGSYTLIYHQKDDDYIKDVNHTEYTAYFNNANIKTKYKYFKLEVIRSNRPADGGTLFQLSEFTMIPTDVTFELTDGDSKALDGNTATQYEANFEEDVYVQYTSVTIHTSSPIQLTKYQLTTADDNIRYSGGRNPTRWNILATNNPDGEWTTLVSEYSNYSMSKSENNYPCIFTVDCSDDTPKYEYFKLEFTHVLGGPTDSDEDYFKLGEVALVPPCVEHQWKELEVVAPTCASVGYSVDECTECKMKRHRDETPKVEHTFGEGPVCEVCGHPKDNYMTDNNGWYEASTVDDITWLAGYARDVKQDINIRLLNDIDLTGFTGFDKGTSAVEFKGELDGQGHWLKNLTIDCSKAYAGLFGKADGATIHDLGLSNCSVKSSQPNVGVLAGNLKDCTVNRVAVMSSYAESNDHVGAIAGNTEGTTVISNCLSDADIKSTNTQAGGLVGATHGMTLTKCLFNGTVNSAVNAAGLICLIEASGVTVSYNITAPKKLQSETYRSGFPLSHTDHKSDTYYKCNYWAESVILADNMYRTGGPYYNDDWIGYPVDEKDFKVKSFYTDSVQWDMKTDWKFIATGKYPVLAWMPAENTQQISIDAKQYATAISADALDFSSVTGLTAYAAQVKDGHVHLTPVNNIPAATAFVVKGGEGTISVPYATEELDAMPGNDLKVSDGNVTGGSTIYVLGSGTKGVGFYPTEATDVISQNQVYLELTTASQTPDFIGFEFDNPTGIEEVTSDKASEVIIYNLNGQRLQSLQKGINIVNGKKIIH